MVEVIKNYTSSDLDEEGHPLLGGNVVSVVYYYSSSNENWRRSYFGVPNPFLNADFTAPTVSGTAKGSAGPGWYETGVDSLVPESDRYFKFFKLPFNWEEELFAKYGTIVETTSTQNGNPANVICDYFVTGTSFTTPPRNTFPQNYNDGFSDSASYATTSGTPGNQDGRFAIDLGPSPPTIGGFYIDSFNGDSISDENAVLASLGSFIIEVSNTGTSDGDYSILVSGTRNETDPLWVDVAPTTARYIRLRYRNRGYSAKSTLVKFWAFSPDTIAKGMSGCFMRVKNHDSVGFDGREFILNQDVDLSNVSSVYIDIKDFVEVSGDLADLYIGGTKIVDLLNQRIVVGGFDHFLQIRGLHLDVSSINNTTFQVRHPAGNSTPTRQIFFSISNVSTVPGWFSEQHSQTRGASAEFPQAALIVVDDKGMSILDISFDIFNNNPNPKLWMRFFLSEKKMLQLKPKTISAREGKIYLGTSGGLFILDFTKNVCVRFDGRGIYYRYGIDYRNFNNYDLGSLPFDSTIPQRTIYTYLRFFDSPIIPEVDINSVETAVDDVLGSYVVLGTARGLVYYNDKIDSSCIFYQSLDKSPVSYVRIASGVIWYIQGDGKSSRLCRIDNPSSMVGGGFVPDVVYHQQGGISDTLSGTIDESLWLKVRQDRDMLLQEGDFLTISGTHLSGGATGIISRDSYADRDFIASVEVKLDGFPSHARGALRFGFCSDYLDAGHRSAYSNYGLSNRNGLFLSAANVDSIGGHLAESSTFDSRWWADQRGWTYMRSDPATAKQYSYIEPSVDGVHFKSFSGDNNTGFHGLLRVVSSWPIPLRPLTITASGQASTGFTSVSSSVNTGPGAWLGLGSKVDFLPGTTGTGNCVDAALMLTGTTTFSGTMVYTVGKIDTNANITSHVLQHSLVQPLLPSEGVDHDSSVYRKWRLDYDHNSGSIIGYIDGDQLSELMLTEYPQPPYAGLSFGMRQRDNVSGNNVREFYFKNISVKYPDLPEAAQNKYLLEWVTNNSGPDRGGIHQSVYQFTTYSGFSLTGDFSPTDTPLTYSVLLSDGSTTTGGVAMASGTSVAVGVNNQSLILGLDVYDSLLTNGWNSTATKDVQLWSSEDNNSWSLIDVINLNLVERSSGKTSLKFDPPVEAKFLKLRGLNDTSSYGVAGGSNWSITEIKPTTISGVGFSSTDATESSDFRQWRLEYTSSNRSFRGYVDDVLVSEGVLPNKLEGGKFVLIHDLAPSESDFSDSFVGSFRNLNVTFPGGDAILPGDQHGMFVTHNVTVSGSLNYTVVCTASGGVSVLDVDLGGTAPGSDSVRFFGRGDLYNLNDYNYALTADYSLSRMSGLLFAGSGKISKANYIHEISKPYWIEGAVDPTSGDEIDFGGRLSLGYHPGVNKIFVTLGTNVAYVSLLDLDLGEWVPVSRGPFAEAVPPTSAGSYLGNAAKIMYSPYDNRIWLVASPTRLVSYDVLYGDTELKTPDSSVSIGTDSGHYFACYVLHNHTIVYGQNFIEMWDVVNNVDHKHPRAWGTSPQRWNRTRATIPWEAGNGLVGGHSNAVYCDYDKCVYFIGSLNSTLNTNNYFYRYDPEKDYLELISSGHEETVSWPFNDSDYSSVTPLRTSRRKSSWLVYDPHRARIYAVGSRGTVPQFYYYDVVNRKWVFPGENPPYIAWRDYPEATDPTDTGVSHTVYNLHRKSLFMYGRAGKDQVLLEYIPERAVDHINFDYKPLRDGLPSNGGVSNHFTRNGPPVQANYGTDLDSFNRDFYRSTVISNNYVSFGLDESHITISGSTTDSSSISNRDFYISSGKLDPTCSFDFVASIAMPSWADSFFHSGGTGQNAYPEAHLSLCIQDGLNRAWVESSAAVGNPDPNMFQVVEIRAGVSGVNNDQFTVYPFVGHIRYSDAQRLGPSQAGITRIINTEYDTYLDGGLLLDSGGFSDFREFRLSYDYDSDSVEGYIDGVSVGQTKLKRKFNPNGVRFGLGYYLAVENTLSQNKHFVAHVKDLRITPKAWEYVSDGRLVTSISGSTGSYYHEKWDSTIASGIDWALSLDAYFSTNKRFSGFDYIGSLVGVGDGHKLVELAGIYGPGQNKQVAVTGSLDDRHLRSSYIAAVNHSWDDIDSGQYRIIKDSSKDEVNIYIGDSVLPDIIVPYNSLPDYKYQHVYYGKVDYGDFERVWLPTVVTGTWNTQPNFTGSPDPTIGKHSWMGLSQSALFATIDQLVPLAEVRYILDGASGNVDLFVFYVSSGFDLPKNTPYIVKSSGVVAIPGDIGDGYVIYSVENDIDQYGNFSLNHTTIRIDQRRLYNHVSASSNNAYLRSSGWVYIGTYNNPTEVYVTANAQAGTTSTQAFVCAGVVGTNIGVRGKSTCDHSLKHIYYVTGTKTLPNLNEENSSISGISSQDNSLLDFYGPTTAPNIPNYSLISADTLEEKK